MDEYQQYLNYILKHNNKKIKVLYEDLKDKDASNDLNRFGLEFIEAKNLEQNPERGKNLIAIKRKDVSKTKGLPTSALTRRKDLMRDIDSALP